MNLFIDIQHDDINVDNKKSRVWFVYFIDKSERNDFITTFKDSWENLFQVFT